MAPREFLLFTLAGPMAAFGKIAVGERRDIWGEPSKSAVLGFIAGALGLSRDAAGDHHTLEAGLGFAARIDDPGKPLRDYHTAHAPKARKNLTWRTRRDELANNGNLNTVLSERIYRVGARATIALWLKDGGGSPDLAELRQAIRRPCFTPYLGRKACPLGEPPRPEIVEAESLLAAFSAYDALRAPEDAKLLEHVRRPRRSAPKSQGSVWFELEAGLAEEDSEAAHIRQRRDAPRDRLLRQFTDRREGRLRVDDDLLEGLVT